mmetsp:Transcript_1719/g.5192  ORF Transcript_1719/g.5192 Transcript_1719/m.5192 type:complete len:208 (+) Transcript_1719:200-823(+)
MAFVSSSGFAGQAVKTRSVTCTGPQTVVMMSAGSNMSRRELLLGALAAMVPAAALAKSGEGPKYSIFGGNSQSSPFVYTDKKKGNAIYKALNDEEIQFLTDKLKESRVRLANTEQYIAIPSWDDIRGEIRLQMYECRRNMLKLEENIEDEKKAQKAKKLYGQLKRDMEELDYACTVKDQGRAKRARSAALKSFDQWAEIAGLDSLDS